MHPRWPQPALRRYCAQQGIAVVAYAPLGCGDLPGRPQAQRAGQLSGLTPAQALLRWALQAGCAVVPKSCQPVRVREWAPAALLGGGSALGPEATAELDGLAAEPHKYCWDPSAVA